jgi:hypothetical protein
VGAGGTGGTSAGTVDGAVDACAPIAEACNGVDDDCDGLVDEELGVVPLGEPIIVRNDEGDTGDCGTCRWAFEPDLWLGSEGLLATWYISFDGSSPRPNLYARRLTVDGAPLGAPFLLLKATGKTPRFAPRTRDRALLALCQRISSRDRPATFELDFSGTVFGAITERSPATSQCRTMSDVGASWTGERFVVAWSDVSAPFGVALDIADAHGASVATRRLDEGGGMPARLATGHGGLVLVTSRAQPPPGTTLLFHRLDALGESIGPPVEYGTMDGLQDAAIGALPDGWLVHAWGPNVGLALRLGNDGTITSIERLARDPESSGFSLAARPGGGSVVVEKRTRGMALPAILRWHRADGSLEATWRAPETDPMGDASVYHHEGITWVVYRTPAESFLPNQIRLRRFGCAETRCPGVDLEYLRERFVSCEDGGRVGQSANAPGATCKDVCCALDFPGCNHRAAQSGFGACNIRNPWMSGGCDDVFQEQWSSQCICTP